MKLDLLRHGEAVGGRIYRGNQDDALTALGWAQMSAAVADKTWDIIATSPLKRCADFATTLADAQNIPLEHVKHFTELGFGDWQGKSPAQIGQNVVDTFKADPINHRPRNAEDLLTCQHRVLRAFADIQARHGDKSVLIIAHANVIRLIKSHLLGLSLEKMFKIDVFPASVAHFDC